MSDHNNLQTHFGSSLTVREKRFDSEIYKQINVKIGDITAALQNISDTGVALFSEVKFDANEEKTMSISMTEDYTLQLKGRVIWQRPEGQGYMCGFHFNNQYLTEGFLEAFAHVIDIKNAVNTEVETYLGLNHDFRNLTYEIKMYLESVKSKLDQLEQKINVSSASVKNSYKEVIKATFEKPFVDQVKLYSKKLDQLFTSFKDKEVKHRHKMFFREQVGPYYTNNPFIGRALVKPRGYAGDYEMMNQIYRDNYEGNNFFEILMHRYGINESSSNSVKYRRGYLCDKIMSLSKGKSHFTFGSVASGPAQEVLEFLSKVTPEDSSRYSIFLIDQDIEALLNAKRNCYEKILSRDLKCKIEFVPVAVKQIIEQAPEAEILKQIKFDFVYTAGLYDYLTQPVAQILTKNVLDLVQPDGHMIIGNFHPNNPTKTISELVADWKLIHRNEEDMEGLVALAQVKKTSIHHDPERIDLFLEIYK